MFPTAQLEQVETYFRAKIPATSSLGTPIHTDGGAYIKDASLQGSVN